MSAKERKTVTILQVESLRKLADGWALTRPDAWEWTDPKGKSHSARSCGAQPHYFVTRGWVAEGKDGVFALTARGRNILKRAESGKIEVKPRNPPRTPKAKAERKRKQPPTPRVGAPAVAGRCATHGTVKVICPGCKIQFCTTCEPERVDVCAYCEEDDRLRKTRREPSRTFGVEARIALRMGRREGM